MKGDPESGGDSGRVESVSEFTRRVKAVLDAHVGPGWVRGEVSNLRAQASGHVYFSLKDSGAQLACVLFRGDALRQSVALRDAGVSWVWWVGFHAVVALVLLGDSLLPGHRSETRSAQKAAWLGTLGLVLAAAGFAAWIAVTMGRQTALEFAAGYTIEASLSVDNLFVFLVLFEGRPFSDED